MSELAREQVAQHIELLSRHLTYPELDALHALDEADATLRATIQEQTERIKELEQSVTVLRWMGQTPKAVPYPDWCRHKDQCAGKSSCPEDPTCAD